jgi:hypothetical protein
VNLSENEMKEIYKDKYQTGNNGSHGGMESGESRHRQEKPYL